MIFLSTINLNARTLNDVLIVRHAEKRKLIRTPDTYSDLEQVTRRLFLLDKETLAFETSALDGCQGENVEIDKEAWEIIAPAVGTVTVVVLAQPPRTAAHPSRNVEPLSCTAQSLSQADTLIGSVDQPAAVKEHTAVGQSNPSMPELRSASPKSYAQFMANLMKKRLDIPENRPSHLEYPISGAQSGAGRTKDVHARRLKQEEGDHEGDSSFEEACLSSQVPSLSKRKVRPIVRGNSSSGGTEWNQRGAREAHIVYDVISQSQASLDPWQTSQESDIRFLISIEHPPTAQQSMFKIRGGHTVAKVLQGVCKSFDLDHESARLFLIIDEDEEVQDAKDQIFECFGGDTMASAGAIAGTRFIVETDEMF